MDENRPWMIRDVPEYVRRKVKLYGAQHGITVAQALESIVNQVIAGTRAEIMQAPWTDSSVPPQPPSDRLDDR